MLLPTQDSCNSEREDEDKEDGADAEISISVDVNDSSDEKELPVKRIVLTGSVDDTSVYKVIEKIFKINEDESAKRIELYLATHGGGIDMGLGLFDVIKMSPIPVDTIVTGCAMSMGMTLLQAGDRRYATANARLMIHPATGGSGYGRIKEGKEAMKACIKLERLNHKLVARRVGMSYNEFLKFMGDANYMSAKEAMKYNFIDGIKKTW